MTFKDHEGHQRVPRIAPQEPMSAPIEVTTVVQDIEESTDDAGTDDRSYLARLRGMLKEPNPYKRLLNVTAFVFCLALGLFIILRSVSPAVLDGGVQQAAELIEQPGSKPVSP